MTESEEIYDVTDMDPKPVNNIKAFINQFNNQTMSNPANRPKPPSAATKPNIQAKPAFQPPVPQKNGVKPVIPTKDILAKKTTLKPVESKTGDAKKSQPDEGKKPVLVPAVFKKPDDKENKPPVTPKKPVPLPKSAPPPNVGGVNLEEFKNRLKKTNGPSQTPVAKKVVSSTEGEFDGEKVYMSPDGFQYRPLKMPVDLGPAPAKPSLPLHPDLYDFQCEDAETEDVYEEYSDVLVAAGNKNNDTLRPISMIPQMTEEEEMDGAEQQEYTDTEVPTNTNRPLSMQDEEYYEALDS